MTKSKVAFICVHNSCRSQIAEEFQKTIREIQRQILALREQLRDS